MPRVIITAVYIPPDVNVNTVLFQLYNIILYYNNIIHKQLQAHPEGAFIVTGDFNKACLQSVLPNCVQYVQCFTRRTNK